MLSRVLCSLVLFLSISQLASAVIVGKRAYVNGQQYSACLSQPGLPNCDVWVHGRGSGRGRPGRGPWRGSNDEAMTQAGADSIANDSVLEQAQSSPDMAQEQTPATTQAGADTLATSVAVWQELPATTASGTDQVVAPATDGQLQSATSDSLGGDTGAGFPQDGQVNTAPGASIGDTGATYPTEGQQTSQPSVESVNPYPTGEQQLPATASVPGPEAIPTYPTESTQQPATTQAGVTQILPSQTAPSSPAVPAPQSSSDSSPDPGTDTGTYSTYQPRSITPHVQFGGDVVACEVNTNYLVYWPFAAQADCEHVCFEVQNVASGKSLFLLHQDSASGGAYDISYPAFIELFPESGGYSGGLPGQIRWADNANCKHLLPPDGRLKLATSSNWGHGCKASAPQSWVAQHADYINVPAAQLGADVAYGNRAETCVYDATWACGPASTTCAAAGAGQPTMDDCKYTNYFTNPVAGGQPLGTVWPGLQIVTGLAPWAGAS